MQATQTTNDKVSIWARLFAQEKPRLSAAAARSILELDFPIQDKERMHELAAKARRGNLSTEEQQEADDYGLIGSLLSILKSRARQALNGGRSGSNDAKLR